MQELSSEKKFDYQKEVIEIIHHAKNTIIGKIEQPENMLQKDKKVILELENIDTKNPSKTLDRCLKLRYGVSLEQYNQLHEQLKELLPNKLKYRAYFAQHVLEHLLSGKELNNERDIIKLSTKIGEDFLFIEKLKKDHISLDEEATKKIAYQLAKSDAFTKEERVNQLLRNEETHHTSISHELQELARLEHRIYEDYQSMDPSQKDYHYMQNYHQCDNRYLKQLHHEDKYQQSIDPHHDNHHHQTQQLTIDHAWQKHHIDPHDTAHHLDHQQHMHDKYADLSHQHDLHRIDTHMENAIAQVQHERELEKQLELELGLHHGPTLSR